jgi:hypothetical protein
MAKILRQYTVRTTKPQLVFEKIFTSIYLLDTGLNNFPLKMYMLMTFYTFTWTVNHEVLKRNVLILKTSKIDFRYQVDLVCCLQLTRTLRTLLGGDLNLMVLENL